MQNNFYNRHISEREASIIKVTVVYKGYVLLLVIAVAS